MDWLAAATSRWPAGAPTDKDLGVRFRPPGPGHLRPGIRAVDACLNVRDVDLVVTQLVTQQSGLASLDFLMITAAMGGSSVFV